jgi:hypothetical protein
MKLGIRNGTISYSWFHSTHIYLPLKTEQTECSETSAYKLQMPGNYPKESIQHTEHGERLKSRSTVIFTIGACDKKVSSIKSVLENYH